MDYKTFHEEACLRCGTQRCYGGKDDLKYCGLWAKVKNFPNTNAKEVIEQKSKERMTVEEILANL